MNMLWKTNYNITHKTNELTQHQNKPVCMNFLDASKDG